MTAALIILAMFIAGVLGLGFLMAHQMNNSDEIGNE